MTPEQLKVIAEGMGYEGLTLHAEHRSLSYIKNGCMGRYNPLTNNDQMSEILKKFIPIGWMVCGVYRWVSIIDFAGNEVGLGEDLNEAVCDAAFEHFK